ncbi:type I-F CRISPR-associated endoribonuclease Cas6/Csy4, partial [Pseudomonas aeruginosa]|nr:type I-F CRISPR-associated endoribonuclease Cas6/Csy4 [Pseudomonas aeruginosa]
MDHYLDIRLRPDPEFPPAQLMSVLFGKLHQALVAQGGDRIGVSFPDLDESRSRLG